MDELCVVRDNSAHRRAELGNTGFVSSGAVKSSVLPNATERVLTTASAAFAS